MDSQTLLSIEIRFEDDKLTCLFEAVDHKSSENKSFYLQDLKNLPPDLLENYINTFIKARAALNAFNPSKYLKEKPEKLKEQVEQLTKQISSLAEEVQKLRVENAKLLKDNQNLREENENFKKLLENCTCNKKDQSE